MNRNIAEVININHEAAAISDIDFPDEGGLEQGQGPLRMEVLSVLNVGYGVKIVILPTVDIGSNDAQVL